MNRFSRTRAVRSCVLVVALLLPAQVLAHCGVLLYGHEHLHIPQVGLHAHEHDAATGNPHPARYEREATSAPALLHAEQACALEVPVFTLRRASEWNPTVQVMARASSPAIQATRATREASVALVFSPLPAASPLPLRI